MIVQEAQNVFRSFTSSKVAYRGALRRLRPMTLNRDAQQHIANLKASNEAYRRLPSTNHKRDEDVVREELLTMRRNAAGVARHHTRGVREAAESLRTLVNEIRRDVTLSMPDALLGLTKDGTVNLALLREALRPVIASASASQLLTAYAAALKRKDAPAVVEVALIEARAVDPMEGLSHTLDDLPDARRLREYVDAVQEMREPIDRPDLDGLSREIDRLNALADTIGLRPLDPDADTIAAAAFDSEHEAMIAAGTPDAEEDLAAVQAELQATGGAQR